MRDAIERQDGSLEISRAVQDHLVDLNRYLRFRAGETFADIALKDNITPDAVKACVRRGRGMYEAEQIIELRDLKHQSAIASERIRKDVREQTQTMVVDGVIKLLHGKRTLSSINKMTGDILTKEIDDPDVISMGVEHAIKIIGLAERPAQSQTFVNIQNNQQNVSEAPVGSTALSYEERLQRIRKAQSRTVTTEREVYDVEPERSQSEDIPEVPLVQPQEPAKEDDWSDF